MLRIRDLSLATQGRQLITGLNGDVLPGECWVVFGKNGAGKTTLLRTLAGLSQPDSGEILLDERPLAGWDRLSLARKRAYLPQRRHDAFAYSVMQTVLAARYPYHAGRYRESASDLAAASFAMQQMDVLSLKDRDIRQLSGGERQRVALAAIFAQDTSLVLLDEPAGSLDLVHQAGLMRLAGKWCREQGKSVMMVMHDLNLAHGVATHALLIREGGTWQAGPVSDVMNAESLSACLGHAVIPFQHERRTVFIPG